MEIAAWVWGHSYRRNEHTHSPGEMLYKAVRPRKSRQAALGIPACAAQPPRSAATIASGSPADLAVLLPCHRRASRTGTPKEGTHRGVAQRETPLNPTRDPSNLQGGGPPLRGVLVRPGRARSSPSRFPKKAARRPEQTPRKKAARRPEPKANSPFDPRADQAPETSSDPSFDPKALAKLAVIVAGDESRLAIQTDQQRLIEDDFVQVLIRKGYTSPPGPTSRRSPGRAFQKSGLTEGNAAALGKLLNVPAVMVVRITESAVERRDNPKLDGAVMEARASLGARLISVESGAILWMGTHGKSSIVGTRGDVALVLDDVARALAGAFSDRIPVETGNAKNASKDVSSDPSFDPKALAKLAIVVAGEGRRQAIQTNQQRLVEDEFVQVLIRKGYSLASRSDIQAIAKEQAFQKSGLTEGNAVALGKLLNVPAVMVVRITESVVETPRNADTGRPSPVARTSLGARLISVESGLILWTGAYIKSSEVDGQGDALRSLADAVKTIAGAFPEKAPTAAGNDKNASKDVSSDSSFDPKALTKLAVIVAEDQRPEGPPGGPATPPRRGRVRAGPDPEGVQPRLPVRHPGDRQGASVPEVGAHRGQRRGPRQAAQRAGRHGARITESAVDEQRDRGTGRPFTKARASLGARLISVESGLILWTGTHTESTEGGRGDLSRVVAYVAKTLAGTFPDKNPPKPVVDEKAEGAPVGQPNQNAARPNDGQVATLLKLGQNLERAKKIDAALEYYRQVVKDFPRTPQAKTATDRIKALTGK